MAFKFRLNIKESTDTGFSNNSSKQGTRMYKKDGTLNVVKRGLSFGDRFSFYQEMLTMSWLKFLIVVFTGYFIINILFSSVYIWIGIENLGGILKTENNLEMFLEAFFFSSQTFTTVGYGSVHPVSLMANFVSSLEALIGLFSFALGTGLLYGRFAKPVVKLLYSDKALISPFKDGKALMFRFANAKNSILSDVEVKVTLAMLVLENNIPIRRFFSLNLESSKVTSLPLSWTIVHHINAESPLKDMNQTDFEQAEIEIIIQTSFFENTSSQFVTHRNSFKDDEIFWGGKFNLIFNKVENTEQTELHLDKLSEFSLIDLPN